MTAALVVVAVVVLFLVVPVAAGRWLARSDDRVQPRRRATPRVEVVDFDPESTGDEG